MNKILTRDGDKFSNSSFPILSDYKKLKTFYKRWSQEADVSVFPLVGIDEYYECMIWKELSLILQEKDDLQNSIKENMKLIFQISVASHLVPEYTIMNKLACQNTTSTRIEGEWFYMENGKVYPNFKALVSKDKGLLALYESHSLLAKWVISICRNLNNKKLEINELMREAIPKVREIKNALNFYEQEYPPKAKRAEQMTAKKILPDNKKLYDQIIQEQKNNIQKYGIGNKSSLRNTIRLHFRGILSEKKIDSLAESIRKYYKKNNIRLK